MWIQKDRALHKALVLLVITLMLGAGCGDSATGPDETTPPELPPTTSMIIPFSDFTQPEAATKRGNDFSLDSAAGANFNYAAGTILFWNVAITLNMAIPVASFVAAFNHEFEFVGDATWESTYGFQPPAGAEHTARLQAKMVSNGIEWKMFISKENSFQDFLWYSGFSDLQNQEGTWNINRNANAPSPFVDIEWQVSSADSTANVKYIYAVPDVPENGSSIHYGVTHETPYDAFYILFSSVLDDTTTIEWNRETKAGRVKSPSHFGDSLFHCWDTAANGLADVDCE